MHKNYHAEMFFMNAVYLKKYDTEKGLMVAACDSGVLGRELKSDNLRLHVREGFYKGDLTDGAGLIDALHEANIANLVGEDTVQCAIGEGYIDAACVIRIGGVPHAQMVRL